LKEKQEAMKVDGEFEELEEKDWEDEQQGADYC